LRSAPGVAAAAAQHAVPGAAVQSEALAALQNAALVAVAA
jgi:hypothetical protein